MSPRRTIISSPEVSSEDESIPKVKPVKKTPVMRTTRAEATRIATGSKPGTRPVVQRKPAAAPVPAASKPKSTPAVKSQTKPTVKSTAKPKATGVVLSPAASATPASPSIAPKQPSNRAPPKQSPPTKTGRMDMLDGDTERDQENEQSSSSLSQLETEIEGDWRKPGSKRPSDECWLFPSLLSKFRRDLLLSIFDQWRTL